MNRSLESIRVAQVVRPAAGGIRRHVSLLVAGLNPHRFVSSVYAPADFSLEPSAPADAACHPLAIGSRTNIPADLRAIRELSRQLRGSVDLVHAHGLRAALIGVLAAQRAGIPALFTAHNLVPRAGRLQRLLLRRVAQSACMVVAVSEAVRLSLAQVGIPADKICVIPNGIPVSAFDVQSKTDVRPLYAIPPDAPLVVGIGRLSYEKGFDLLISAFPDVGNVHSHPHLLLVGNGPEAQLLREQARNSPCAASIHFAGRVQDVAPYLHAADVVVVPSREEGQGIVALEAMAARRPVVAAHVGGLPETVLNGITGLLVPPASPPLLAGTLSQLLHDSALRANMGAQGRARVEQLFTLERMIHNIEAIYQASAAVAA